MLNFLFVLYFIGSLKEAHPVSLEEARTRLTILLEHSTKEAEEAFQHFSYREYLIRERSNQIYVSGPKQIKHEETIIAAEIVKIVNDASNDGVNSTSCVLSQTGLYNELFDLCMLAMGNCVLDNSNGALTTLNKAISGINLIIAELFILSQKMENCRMDDSKCINEIISEISFKEIDVPRQLQESIDFADNRVEAYSLKLSVCGSREAINFQKYGVTILNTIQKCIDDLINQQKPTSKPLLIN